MKTKLLILFILTRYICLSQNADQELLVTFAKQTIQNYFQDEEGIVYFRNSNIDLPEFISFDKFNIQFVLPHQEKVLFRNDKSNFIYSIRYKEVSMDTIIFNISYFEVNYYGDDFYLYNSHCNWWSGKTPTARFIYNKESSQWELDYMDRKNKNVGVN